MKISFDRYLGAFFPFDAEEDFPEPWHPFDGGSGNHSLRPQEGTVDARSPKVAHSPGDWFSTPLFLNLNKKIAVVKFFDNPPAD